MPKPFTCHAVVRRTDGSLAVMGVTRITRLRVWGRYLTDDDKTIRANRDVLAYYRTEAAAVAALLRAEGERRAWAVRVAAIEDDLANARDRMADSIDDALNSADRVNP